MAGHFHEGRCIGIPSEGHFTIPMEEMPILTDLAREAPQEHADGDRGR